MSSPSGKWSVGVCSTHEAYWSAASGLLTFASRMGARPDRASRGFAHPSLAERHRVLDHLATLDTVVLDANHKGFVAVVPAGDEPPVGTVAWLRREGVNRP